MDDLFDVTSILGTWKQWAQHLKSEINGLNTEIKTLQSATHTQVGDVYARIDNRHDAIRALLTEAEARLREEVARVQEKIDKGVDRDSVKRIQDKVDLAAAQTSVDAHADLIRTLERDLLVLQTKCQVWGVVAGFITSLVVLFIERVLDK